MKFKIKVLIYFFMMFSLNTSFANTFEDGLAEYRNGRYDQAYLILLPLAEHGDAKSQTLIGYIFQENKKNKFAFEWFKKAADQGLAVAMNEIGYMYNNGEGVTQDYNEALKWYKMAASQGYAQSQNNIGVMYAFGNGVIQNYQEANKWFELAAEQGDAVAQYKLGLAYETGVLGAKQNFIKAKKYYEDAISGGITEAKGRLSYVNKVLATSQKKHLEKNKSNNDPLNIR